LIKNAEFFAYFREKDSDLREVTYWLLCGVDFCLLTFSILLLFRQDGAHFCKRLLGAMFLILAWYIMMTMLVLSGALARYPFLFRAGVPFYYLAAPLLYIYVRSECSGESKFRRYDWLHFGPAVLAFVDLFPYYFLTSHSVKSAEMLMYADDPTVITSIGRGFLPPVVHYGLRCSLSLVYVICQWQLLFGKSTRRKERPSVSSMTKAVSILVGLMYLGNSVLCFGTVRNAQWIDFDHLSSFHDYAVLFTIAYVVTLSVYIFDNPTLLYGRGEPVVEKTPLNIAKEDEEPAFSVRDSAPEVKSGISPEFISDFIPRLEEYMQSSQAYRRKGVTLYEIAKDLEVSPGTLSSLLNSHYNQRFNDYINQYRINHVLARMQSDSEWRMLSIEGLAEDAGFSSRTPFYAAFKKFTGMTPSSYIKKNIES